MTKRLLCGIAAVLTLLCTIRICAGSVSAQRQYENCISRCQLYDPDNIFDEVAQQSLSMTIRDASDETDMYVAVYILSEKSPSYSDSQVMVMADDAYDELFNPQYGVDTDGVLLWLNLSTRYAYISTSGMGQLYYYNGSDDDRISTMISDMRSWLQNEDYSGAIRTFCADVTRYYDKGIPKNAYTYNEGTKQYAYESHGELVYADHLPFGFGVAWGFVISVGLLTGAITGLIAWLCIASSYRMKKSLAPINYVSHQETVFYVQDDIFLRKHVTRHRIETDSGGGGGGGGGSSHSSGGGHSHGGGGGHW